MEKRIYLIGYMASGKTTVGKQLARLLEYSFHDLDQLMEQATGKTIGALFDKPDGKEFRKIEKEVLRQTFSLRHAVVACGGGTPCFFNNMDDIKKHGLAVWVRPDPMVIVERLKIVKHSRPLLADIPDDQLPQTVLDHYHEREKFYSIADIHFNPDEETVEQLANRIKVHK